MHKGVLMDSEFFIRDLQIEDYEKGYVALLSQLTETGNITKEMFNKRFEMLKNNEDYVLRVIIEKSSGNVVGAGTLFLEHKFIHNCATKGHIEDIVVDSKCRGKKLGHIIVEDLVKISQAKGAYKTALCCRDEIVGFYEKCDFKIKEREMVIYHSEQ
ncbi:Glucosamine-phosphate N-acetyltransferase-like protein [Gurleya vavrai]